MSARYTEEEAETIRSFVRRRVEARERARSKLLNRARRESEAIVVRLSRELKPQRIYLWGSVVLGDHFSDRSDIDIAVEDARDPRRLYELAGELQRESSFELDIVRMESIHPAYAEHIRRRGRSVYEREAGR